MGIKKVKLNYKPIAKRKNNDIAYVVDSSHVIAINTALENKIKKNILEQQDHSSAQNLVCKQKEEPH